MRERSPYNPQDLLGAAISAAGATAQADLTSTPDSVTGLDPHGFYRVCCSVNALVSFGSTPVANGFVMGAFIPEVFAMGGETVINCKLLDDAGDEGVLTVTKMVINPYEAA